MRKLNEDFDFDDKAIDNSIDDDFRKSVGEAKIKSVINDFLKFYYELNINNKLECMSKLFSYFGLDYEINEEPYSKISRQDKVYPMANVKYNGQEIFRVNTGESKYRVITDTVAKIANWKVKEITGKDFADVFGRSFNDYKNHYYKTTSNPLSFLDESFEFDSDDAISKEVEASVKISRIKSEIKDYFREWHKSYNGKRKPFIDWAEQFGFNFFEHPRRKGTYVIINKDGDNAVFINQADIFLSPEYSLFLFYLIKYSIKRDYGFLIQISEMKKTYEEMMRTEFSKVSEGLEFDDNNIDDKFAKDVSKTKALTEIREAREQLQDEYDYEVEKKGSIQEWDKGSTYFTSLMDFIENDLGLKHKIQNRRIKENRMDDGTIIIDLIVYTPRDHEDIDFNFYEEFDLVEAWEDDYEPIVRFYLETLFYKLTGTYFEEEYPDTDILKMKLNKDFDFEDEDKIDDEMAKRVHDISIRVQKEKRASEIKNNLDVNKLVKTVRLKKFIEDIFGFTYLYGVDNDWHFQVFYKDKLILDLEEWLNTEDLIKAIIDEYVNNPEIPVHPEEALNEGLPFGDPLGAGNSEGIQNNGDPFCEYKLMPLTSNLSQKDKPIRLGEFPIYPGVYVTGKCPIDNEFHWGYVYRILKNPDSSIAWVYILTDDTKEFIRLDPDTISLSTPIDVVKKRLADPFKNYRKGSELEGGTSNVV